MCVLHQQISFLFVMIHLSHLNTKMSAFDQSFHCSYLYLPKDQHVQMPTNSKQQQYPLVRPQTVLIQVLVTNYHHSTNRKQWSLMPSS